MATYNKIQDWIKQNYGYSAKTCWIAHVKEMCGLPLRNAPNRIDEIKRTNECPQNKIESIKQAFRFFRMI